MNSLLFAAILTVTILTLTPLEIVAQPQTIRVPVEVNPLRFTDHGLNFKKVTIYLNTTDKNYHLKTLEQNTLPETRTGSLDIGFRFIDKATNTYVKEIFSPYKEVTIDPGAAIPLDLNTGYRAINSIL